MEVEVRETEEGGGGGEMEYVKEDVRTLDMTSDRKEWRIRIWEI